LSAHRDESNAHRYESNTRRDESNAHRYESSSHRDESNAHRYESNAHRDESPFGDEASALEPMLGFFERLVKDAATDFALPEYT
jgi:hypothetical protein